MNDQKRLAVRITGIVDILFITVLILRGWSWFGTIVLVEAVMWIVRLIWISPVLLMFILRRLLH
ncbi:MAG: hypothetical protein CMN78_01045, partial [Spirochaetales bacterium]|nr:hypothetical protein [Spirochaetales bacterium]